MYGKGRIHHVARATGVRSLALLAASLCTGAVFVMTTTADKHLDDKPRWQFNLRQLFVVSAVGALLFAVCRQWPRTVESLPSTAWGTLVDSLPAFVGLLLCGYLASTCKLSRPGQWLVAGAGFTMTALNTWGVPSISGVFGSRVYYEYGWPLPFRVSFRDSFWGSQFYSWVLLIDVTVCGVLTFLALRFARRLEGSWNLVTPTRQASMLTLLFGPAALLHVARYAGFPQHLVIAAVAIPVAAGILWGICESSRGLARLDVEEAEDAG